MQDGRREQLRFDVGVLERDRQQQEPTLWITERVCGRGRLFCVRGTLAVHLEPSNAVSVDAVEVVTRVPAGTLGFDARVKWIDLALSDGSFTVGRFAGVGAV